MRPFLPAVLLTLAACGRTGLEREAPDASQPGPPLQPGLDAGADAGAPADAGLVSEIGFEDVHFVTGNPRKLNPNRRDGTDPDNVVRLWVEPRRAGLSLEWRANLGELDTPSAASVRFRSAREGTAHLTCTAKLPSGEAEVRATTVVVKRVHRNGARIHGDWVAFNTIAPQEVIAVSVSTRAQVELGPGQLLAFDGDTLAVRPLRSGNRTLGLWHAGNWTTRGVAPASIQSSWDFRALGLTGGRLYLAATDASYTQDTLYVTELAGGAERRLAGPTGLRGAAVWGGRLAFSEATAPAYAFRSWEIEGGATPQPLPTVDATQVVRAWSGDRLAVQSTRGYAILDRATGRSVDVPTRLGSVTSVVLSATHVGGHDRNPWGARGAVFLDALDGSSQWRGDLDTNDFANPSIDGRRLVWVHQNAVWLYEAP